MMDGALHIPDFLVYSIITGEAYWFLGYISLIMMIIKSGIFSRKWSILAPIGQMAFSNYLLQTIICTTIFYGYGYGNFGKFSRVEQIIVVGCIWLFQIIFSKLWLKYFKYGPFEWLWRVLSYKKFLPIKRQIQNN